MAALLSLSLLPFAQAAGLQAATDRSIEERIIRHLKENLKPGEPLIVSDLYNKVFTDPAERKVLDRLFNTFFKIPLFVAQYKAATNEIPTLADISRQFNLQIEGEAAVLLAIIDSDPRVPQFIRRDPDSGEIASVDIEAVKRDRRFGKLIERTVMGWEGRLAPQFTLELMGGGSLSSEDLKGKSYLLYFWFSGCPPCVRISPHLVELQQEFAARNFTVVAVNADRILELETTDQQRAAYMAKAGYNFPAGHLGTQMQEAFGSVNVYPTLFLVDPSGLVHKNYVNYQPLETLRKDIAELLARSDAAR